MTVETFPDQPDDVWIISGDRGEMRPGFYKKQLVRGGPYVAVCLVVIEPEFGEDGDPLWDFAYELTIDGASKDPFKVDGLAGEPISAADYRYMVAMRAHAIAHEPDMPEANPRQPVDFNKLHFRFGKD